MVQPVTFHASPSTVAMMRGFVTTVLKIEGFLPTAPPSAFATTEAKTLTAMVLLIGTQKAMSSARSANPVWSKSCRQMEKTDVRIKAKSALENRSVRYGIVFDKKSQ